MPKTENKVFMPAQEFQDVSFYIIAHADDWQLFMQPNAFYDLVRPGSKVVFIVTTAGDAGLNETFWKAREEGMKSSVRFCLAPHTTLTENAGIFVACGHSIHHWSVNDSICYFLRLPDGGIGGNGFDSHHFKSLTKLFNGEIRTLSTVDKTAEYDGWSDLSSTLEGIIAHEIEPSASCRINFLNPDEKTNCNDHADHIATGKAIQNMKILNSLRQALFPGYNAENDSGSLNANELFWKTGMLAAYEKSVFDLSGYSTFKENIELYQKWCLRNAGFVTR